MDVIMQIDQIHFGSWGEAWRCRHGKLELIVGGGISPRIVSFRRENSENILFEDPEGRFGRGPWRLLGGHRLWIAPETEATYETETPPRDIQVEGDRFIVSCAPGASLLRRRIEIGPSDRCAGFRIRHEILNESAFPSGPVAPWAITCVKPAGKITIPWGIGPKGWRMQTVRYWRELGGIATNPASSQWRPEGDRFLVEPNGDWGKIGVASEGPVTHTTPAGAFIKHIDYITGATYPDGGCNIEVFTASEYMEVETLGPLTELMPGAVKMHDEHWELKPDS